MILPAVRRNYSSGDRTFHLSIPEIDLAPGELVYLAGPNGSGKSLYFMALASQAVEGELRNGRDKCEASVTLLRQHALNSLAPSLTAAENLLLWRPASSLAEHLFPNRATRRLRAEISQRFPVLSNVWGQETATLSGGQQQALALASRAIAPSDILLLDEFIAASDSATADTMLRFVKSSTNDLRHFTITITHDVAEIAAFADRLLVFSQGSLFRDLRRTEGALQSAEIGQVLSAAWIAQTNL